MMNSKLLVDTARLLLVGLALTTGVGKSMATLGQTSSTVPVPSSSALAPGIKALAVSPDARASRVTVHQTQLENGTLVMEYATPSGPVFAVSWRGPVLPDLSDLLGDYFNTFKLETDKARLAGRRGAPVTIERDGLIVSSKGRMRNFFGYAYAPALVPAGVNIKDVLQ